MPTAELFSEPTGRVEAVIERGRPVHCRLSSEPTGRVEAELTARDAGG